MSYKDLIELITHLNESDIAYVDFKNENEHIVLSKEVPQLYSNSQDTQQVEQKQETSVQSTTSVENTESNSPIKELQEQTDSEKNKDENAVKSPMVGVVYLQPQPDADPYVKVGDRIEQGDVVCIVEAMKLMNEIQAPHGGIVKEIIVENEDVVEFNQPLIYIEP